MEMMDWKKNSSCAYFEYDMINLDVLIIFTHGDVK